VKLLIALPMAIAVPSLLVHRGCITAVARTFCPAVIMVDPPGTRQRRLRPTPGRCAAPSRIDGPLELQDFTEAPFVVLVDTGIRRAWSSTAASTSGTT
jgi:hypothetical protein